MPGWTLANCVSLGKLFHFWALVSLSVAGGRRALHCLQTNFRHFCPCGNSGGAQSTSGGCVVGAEEEGQPGAAWGAAGSPPSCLSPPLFSSPGCFSLSPVAVTCLPLLSLSQDGFSHLPVHTPLPFCLRSVFLSPCVCFHL